MSTPMSRIQSGIAYQTSPSGRPDANDCRTTNAVRFDRIARARLARAPPPGLGEGRFIATDYNPASREDRRRSTPLMAVAVFCCAVAALAAQGSQAGDLAARVRALEDREAIRTLWAEYGRTLDARSREPTAGPRS